MVVCLFLSAFLTFIVYDYIFCILNKQKFDIKIKNITIALLTSILWIIINYNFSNIARPIVTNICLFLMFLVLYKKSVAQIILNLLLIYILMMVSETIFILLFVHLPNTNVKIFEYDILAEFFANLFIAILTIIFINIKFFKNILVYIATCSKEKKNMRLIILVIIAFGIIAYFTYLNYNGLKSLFYLVGINIILITIYIFIIGFFKEHAENNKLLNEYDMQMNYVKTYEKLAHDKQKEQHEYRNQLSLIRSMIESKDNRVILYIDKLLEIDGQNQSHQYFEQLAHIPSGGLKGFILFKINEMVDLGIEVVVNVEEELEKEKYWYICDKELTDVSRAIGVYMDNAKEAASKAKQKFVIIDVTIENNFLTFTFSNTFAGEIDFSKVGQQGYSTKGSNHGHGLSLINELIEKNTHLKQSKQINGIYYVQNLIKSLELNSSHFYFLIILFGISGSSIQPTIHIVEILAPIFAIKSNNILYPPFLLYIKHCLISIHIINNYYN